MSWKTMMRSRVNIVCNNSLRKTIMWLNLCQRQLLSLECACSFWWSKIAPDKKHHRQLPLPIIFFGCTGRPFLDIEFVGTLRLWCILADMPMEVSIAALSCHSVPTGVKFRWSPARGTWVEDIMIHGFTTVWLWGPFGGYLVEVWF